MIAPCVPISFRRINDKNDLAIISRFCVAKECNANNLVFKKIKICKQLKHKMAFILVQENKRATALSLRNSTFLVGFFFFSFLS